MAAIAFQKERHRSIFLLKVQQMAISLLLFSSGYYSLKNNLIFILFLEIFTMYTTSYKNNYQDTDNRICVVFVITNLRHSHSQIIKLRPLNNEG